MVRRGIELCLLHHLCIFRVLMSKWVWCNLVFIVLCRNHEWCKKSVNFVSKVRYVFFYTTRDFYIKNKNHVHRDHNSLLCNHCKFYTNNEFGKYLSNVRAFCTIYNIGNIPTNICILHSTWCSLS